MQGITINDSTNELAIQLRRTISFEEAMLLPAIYFLWSCAENGRAKSQLIK